LAISAALSLARYVVGIEIERGKLRRLRSGKDPVSGRSIDF
jgi:hypothetical protein